MKRFLQFRASRNLSGWLTILAALIPALSNAQLVPAIYSFNPISGTVGMGVNITGTNFNPVASSNIVFFGAVQAAVAAASATNLTVTVPAGSTYVPITEMVNGLTAWSGQSFLPTFAGNGQIDAGTLATRLDLPSVNGGGMMIIADLDGDGKADVTVCCGNHLVGIYRNISTSGSLTAGSFAPRVDLSLGSGGDGNVVAADLDGDGKLDLVFVDSGANQVAVLRNLSSPGNLTTNSFAPRVNFSVGSSPRGIAVRDLDGDGKPEVVSANWSDNTVSILRNVGSGGGITTGSFAPTVNFAVGPGPQSVAIADLDGDGRPDVVTANINGGSSQSVSVLRNISTLGNIAMATEVDLAGVPTSFCVAVGDLDGDGKLDLAISSFNAGQAVSVYRNVSVPGSITTGSFAARVDLDVGGWGNAVAMGDLDGDGKPDLAVVTQLPDHLSLFKNLSMPGSITSGSFAARVDYSAGYNPNGIVVGDLDGDGRPDVVFANDYDSTISIYQNQTAFGLPPTFNSQPLSSTNAVGSTVVLAANVSGATPISYQWLFNGAPLTDSGRISGSTNSTLTISNLQTSDIGNYQLLATNVLGSTNSLTAFLDVVYVLVPPSITQQPVSQNVVAGTNVILSVTVAGDIPLSYQWFFNGTALTDNGHIIGSASGTLTVSNVQPADTGNYSIIVTNWAGSATSLTAVVTVMIPPTITVQPVGRSVPPGLPTTITAAFTGGALSYQWQLNGVDISGATNTSYSIAAVGTNDLGFYHLVASNSVNVAVSADAQLTFGPVAAWGANFNNQCLPPPGLSRVTAIAGCSAASFAVRTDGTVSAWGTGAATNIPASVSNVVAVAAIGGFGGYALRSDGTVGGWNTISAPVLSNIVMVAAGGINFGYALRAEGTLTGWGSVPIPGFPAGLNHVLAIACGYNNAVALRNDGTITVAGSGVVTNVPVGLSNVVAVAAGYTYAMALKADGTVVAWGSGSGTNLPAGMTNIAAISAGNAGSENFGVAVRSNGTVVAWGDNPNGEASPPAALTNLVSIAGAAVPYHGLALVNDGSPVILHPPVGLTACTGRNVTLRGGAVGLAPLTYQWLLNGTNLPGATNASLVIPNVQFSQAGNYQLFVSNAVNTALSLPAPLTVISNSALTFLGAPSNQTNYQGSKVSLGVAVLGNGPLRYQWYYAATNFGSPSIYAAIPGATNDALVLDPALAINTGNYYVAVSNQVSGITSLPTFVRLLFAKAWGYLPTDPPFNVTNATAIAVGNVGQGNVAGHYLVLKSDGKVASWAGIFPNYGETNVSVLSNSIVTAIAAGYQDSLALKSDGTVYAWGYNAYGETNVPAGLNGVTAIACGDYHDLALKSDGTVVGWGQNIYLQATNAAATNVVAIAAGGQNSIALRADGAAVTWGLNGSGQYPIPFNATNIVAVAAGGTHFLALRANGTVVGWGNNPYGQTTIPANWTNIVAIAAAMNHSVALRNDGTILTLGNYYNGPTLTPGSVPSDLANVVAIASGGDHDLALFGTRVPSFTVHPWNRSVPSSARTNITLTGKCAGVQPVYYQWQLNGTNVPGATNDTLILTNQPSVGQPIRLIPTGAYQLIASNVYGVAASKYAKITSFYPLGDALDATNLNWITSGNAPWFGETNVTHDGVDAAQGGGIGALQETILQTTLVTNWSGRCTFWWKVSSELDFDFLEFRVNGIVQTNISGEVNWQQASIPVAAGANVLTWRYSKDASFDAGQDAGWVDQFVFIADPPVITNQPASQTVKMNATVLLTVTAGGPPPLRYQWRQNGNPIGGNSPTLVLSNVGRAQSGTYFVTVTNSSGSTVSSNAVLKVLVPQLLSTPTLSPDGTLQLTSTDADGGLLSPADLPNFEAQASTNLMDWVTLPGSLSLTNGMLQLQDNSGTNQPARFYRLLEHY